MENRANTVETRPPEEIQTRYLRKAASGAMAMVGAETFGRTEEIVTSKQNELPLLCRE